MDPCYLFFSPEAGVVPHFAAQCLLARILKEKGHRVLFVRCHALYPHCPVMDMYLLQHADSRANQQKVCGECENASKVLLGQYGLDSVDMTEFLAVDMVERIAIAMDGAPADLREFRYDGIPFGVMTIEDMVLATKISDFVNLSEAHRDAWRKYISGALVSYLVTEAILREMPVAGVVHHEDYGILLGARLAAEKHGVPAVHIGFTGHMGGDRRKIFIEHLPGSGEHQKLMLEWPKWRELSLPAEAVREPMNDILARLGSSTSRVYSPKKTFGDRDLHRELGLPPGKKLLVAFTSSLDERMAVDSVLDAMSLRQFHHKQPFENQIEWLGALCDFVAGRDDYFLVVRVHPREGANKRESAVSQHLGLLKSAFEGPRLNTLFIWPGMDVSSYDLAELADLVLTAWTTLGLEVGRLGVPVLAYTYGLGPRPVDDFIEWAPTREAYFRKFSEIMALPPRLETLLHAFRWHMVLYMGHAANLGDIIPAPDTHGLQPFFMPREADAVVAVMTQGRSMLDINRQRLVRKQHVDSVAEERLALRRQLRKALRFLFTGRDEEDDYRLALVVKDISPGDFRDGFGSETAQPGTAVALIQGDAIHFLEGGKTHSRRSPMCARLALLSCDTALGNLNPLPAEAGKPMDATGLRAWLAGEETITVPAGDPDPLAAAASVFKRAMELKEESRVEEAGREVAAALSRGVRSPELLNLQGHLECLGGNPRQGMEAFRTVAHEWPRYAKAHNNLAVLTWNDGERDEALGHQERALEHGPDDPEIVANSVRMLLAMGHRARAESVAAAFHKVNPGAAAPIDAMLGAPAGDWSTSETPASPPVQADDKAHPMRILWQGRGDLHAYPLGDGAVVDSVMRGLKESGMQASLSLAGNPDLSGVDVVQLANMVHTRDTRLQLANAKAAGKPTVLIPMYEDLDRYLVRAIKTNAIFRFLAAEKKPIQLENVAKLRDAFELAAHPLDEPGARHFGIGDAEAQKSILEGVDRIFTSGKAESESIRARFGKGLPISEMPYCFNPRFASGDPAAFTRRFGISDFALCVGRLEARKNQWQLIEVFRGLPHLKLVLIGAFTDPSMEPLIKAYAPPNVVFIRGLPLDELAGAYAAARLHVLPSWYELPGLANLEAAAAGCRVVTTDWGTPRDYLGDQAGYCDPSDPLSIRKAVLDAWDRPADPSLRERVIRDFTWKRSTARCLEAYREIAKG